MCVCGKVHSRVAPGLRMQGRSPDATTPRRPANAASANQATPAGPALPARRVAPLGGRSEATGGPYFIASAVHFLTKLFFAAPASFLSPACVSQAAIAVFAAPALVAVFASVAHFLTKLFFAAPASFLSAACVSQAALAVPAPASASHFFMKLVLAAPASFFSVAFASHPASAA